MDDTPDSCPNELNKKRKRSVWRTLQEIGDKMVNIFKSTSAKDVETVRCNVTMDDLIATHAATMQDPIVGPVDDVEIDGVTNATTKRQRTIPNGINDADSDSAAASLQTVEDRHAAALSSSSSVASDAQPTCAPSNGGRSPVPHVAASSPPPSPSSSASATSDAKTSRPPTASNSGHHSRTPSSHSTVAGRDAWIAHLTRKSARPTLKYQDFVSKRKQALNNKIKAGTKHLAEVVASDADMSQPQSTKTGWSGKDYRFRPDKDKILRAWRDGTMRQLLFRDMSFRKVPYTGRPVYLVDGAGTAYGFRADVSSWMFKPEAVWDGRNFLEQIAFESLRYRDECGDRSQKDIDANHRGDHWYNVIGVDRQIKQSPKLTVFHTLHMAQTDKLLWDKGATRRLIAFAADILRTRFPCLAERVERCAAKLLEQGWDYAIPMFECWYNYCINAPRPGSQLGVCTEPHVDGKNLALMVCAVFVWGNFDSKEKAWLVLWEAGLVIELPVGVLILYPSSLFLHFNVNMSALPIVTTADGQLPTPQNSTPLESVVGRGSIVLFNQASMFQLAELGCSVKEAQQAKMASTCDNAVHVARLPVP